MNNTVDVAILGGGLAGLCLARQLLLESRDSNADAMSITVLESASFPAPVAAHKVGESTVEIGAHYLADTLQLREVLDRDHLKKFGLRCYFGDSTDLSKADELGASESLPVSSYQIDRGMLENYLVTSLQSDGVVVHGGARVLDTRFAKDGSGTVNYVSRDQEHEITARWIVDASGRRGLFRRQRGLKQQNGLSGNACWFRVDDQIRIDDWCADARWHQKITCGERWLSTNHLMGHGYWVWLIPLGSGATSVGIVTSADMYNIKDFTSYDRTIGWLGKHQPLCAEALTGLEPMDHRWLRNYSYGCNEVFSRQPDHQRWGLTGEAGLFLDPFYSPGMDFIAYSNTFLSDLIRRDRLGENIRARQLIYQQTYQSIYESSLQLYKNQYPGFGNFRLMSLKTIWDYAYYWGVLGLLYFNRALTDMDLLKSRMQALSVVRQRHGQLQDKFSNLALREPVVPPSGSFTDHFKIPLLHRLNSELADRLDGEKLATRFDENLCCLQELADEIELILLNNDSSPMDLKSSISNLSEHAF